MKNRRGEIATLLTLGLVLVGGVAAIATSIFTNNQKNLASGARAGTTYSCCKVYENSSVCNGGKRILNIGNAYQSACSANGAVDCSSVGGPTASGGSKCVGTPPPAAVSVSPAQGQGPAVSPASTANQCEQTSGQYCLPLVSTAAGYDNCAPNTFVGMGSTMCNDSKKVCCRGNKPTTGGSFTGSTPVSSSVSPAAASTDVLTPDRLCCKTYSCGQYGASADQKMVKVVGYTGTYKGTDGYTSCATTGYTNVQQCSSIPGAPTSNGATGFVACDPGANPSAVNPVNNAVTGTGNSGTGLTGPGGVEYCCIVYKQGLYASQYGCDASQYVAKVVGFTGTKDGTDGYTSCATTGYEKYSSIQKVGNCSSMAETQSLAGAGSGSICVGNPDAAPVQLSACEQTSGQYCLPLVSTAAGYDNCAPNTFVGMGSTMCGDSTKVCCRGNKTQTGGNFTNSQIRKCPNGSTATCIFGNNDTGTGPGLCSGVTTSSIKGCSAVPAGSCDTFTDINKCVAAQQAGRGCAWNGTTNKCIQQTAAGTGNTVNSCTAKSCRKLDTRYEDKNYYEMNGKFYQDAPCLETKRIADNNSLALFCANQNPGLDFGAALDNACVQKTGNPLAYCSAPSVGPAILPARHFPCKAGYEFSTQTCNQAGMLCCIPKATAQSCVKKNCQDINNNYTASKGVYQKDSVSYATLNDCSNGTNAIGDIVMYCNQSFGIQASADNSCKNQTGDPQAYCNNIGPFGTNTLLTRNLPCKDGFQQASARCGVPSTVCCVQARQQTQGETTIECTSISYDESGNLVCNQ